MYGYQTPFMAFYLIKYYNEVVITFFIVLWYLFKNVDHPAPRSIEIKLKICAYLLPMYSVSKPFLR